MIEPFFNIFPILFAIMFLLFIGVFLFVLIQGLTQWNKNNHSPRLSVPAVIVSKRTQVRHSHHGAAGEVHHCSTYTTYYATFQVASGDRMELTIPGTEYGMLAEGDRGILSFQGTRYLGFARQ